MAKKKTETAAAPAPPPPPSPSELTAFTTEPEADKPFAVPGKPRILANAMERSMFWFYGPNGIGKTTLASTFPGVWFLATETGQGFADVREPTIIQSWEHFLNFCAWIEETKPTRFADDNHPIKYFCIDSVDYLHRMCMADVAQQLGIDHPGDETHGKGWNRLNEEFERVITKLRRWPFGLIAISHEADKPFKTRTREITRVAPDMGKGGYRTLSALADFIFYCHSEEYAEKNEKGDATGRILERRLLRCHPTGNIIAKNRKRDCPEVLPMDYKEIAKALSK